MAAANDALTFITRIINRAYRLSGALRKGATPDAEQVSDGIISLNQILAEWAESGVYIFFTTKFTFQATAAKLIYTVGTGLDAEVITNPFVEITNVNYDVGSVTYSPEYLTRKEFDAIGYKQTSAFPGYWTYTVLNKVTEVGFWPETTGSELITLTGKQRLDSVDLFEDASSEIPAYAINALTYYLAAEVSVFENSVPSNSFDERMKYHYSILTENNKIDLQSNQKLPFLTSRTGGNTMRGGY